MSQTTAFHTDGSAALQVDVTGSVEGIVDRDEWGFVVTDACYRTSMRGVYAAGDCRSGSTKQLAAATGEAVAAVLAIRGYLQEHSHLPRIDINVHHAPGCSRPADHS